MDKPDENEEDCTFTNIEEKQSPRQDAGEGLALLPPDHPLLRRFQQSLKEHLLRTKLKLENEIEEIKGQVKAKQQRREEQGLSLYEMQQKILVQKELIKDTSAEIEEQVEKRMNEEKIVADLKEEYETKVKLTKEEKSEYNKSLYELEHLQTLVGNIKTWAYDVEDEVKNAKRIVSRDAQLQKQLSDEKRKSDMMFFRLDTEVKKAEAELQNIIEEEEAMTEVINILNMSVADANTDLEALQNEHKRLTQAWSEVIIAIQLRDKILFQVTENLKKEQESIKLNIVGIEAIKKQITKEMDMNKKLEIFKQRLADDFSSLKRECQKESDILAALQVKLEDMPNWMMRTENELQEATREGTKIMSEIRRLQFKLDKLHHQKFKMEETILSLAQEQLISDKASAYRLKLLDKSQEQRRKMDLSLAQAQNQLATALVDLERTRGQIFNLEKDNSVLQARLDETEAKCTSLDNELKNIQNQIDLKIKSMDKINREIDEANKGLGEAAGNPTELKIKQVEKSIQQAELQIKEHQQFWIMLQNHFVNLSQKRNDQLNEIQITRKQLSIIKQKSLKIDQELEVAEQKTKELKLYINQQTTKIELLNDKIFKTRQHHDSEETVCELEHIEMTQKLKDNEMNILGIESEIEDLQTDIELHKDLVLDKHRESLSWETKYKLIEETIRWYKTDSAKDGEVGLMRVEIHRMNIRYQQLKRAQEKLVQDLEHCVMHREQIFVAATVKDHVEAKKMRVKTLSQTQVKINDLRNKIKSIQTEITMLTGERLSQAVFEIERVEHMIIKIQEDLKQITDEDNKLLAKINDCVLQKHSNLEQIIRKQNRAKAYRKLNNTKLPLKTMRSESTIQLQRQKQNEMNDLLQEVIQICLNDYPDKTEYFTKLMNVLKE